jgi:hypothetical protein
VRTTFELWVRTDYRFIPPEVQENGLDWWWLEDMKLCLRLLAFQRQPVSETLQGYFNTRRST